MNLIPNVPLDSFDQSHGNPEIYQLASLNQGCFLQKIGMAEALHALSLMEIRLYELDPAFNVLLNNVVSQNIELFLFRIVNRNINCCHHCSWGAAIRYVSL